MDNSIYNSRNYKKYTSNNPFSPFSHYHPKRLEDQLYIIPEARILYVLQVELDLLLHDDLDVVRLGVQWRTSGRSTRQVYTPFTIPQTRFHTKWTTAQMG